MVLRVTVNILDCYLLLIVVWRSYLHSLEVWVGVLWHSPNPVAHMYLTKCTWEEAVRGQVLGGSPSPSAKTSTPSGDDGFQWSDLNKKLVIGLGTDSRTVRTMGFASWMWSVNSKEGNPEVSVLHSY